jgi:restriction system protein
LGKTYLSKANLIEITRGGYFKITNRGEDVLRSQPTRIDNNFLAKFSEFREFRKRSSEGAEQSAQLNTAISDDRKQTPDEIMRDAHREIETSLAQELLDRISKAPPEFFERLMVSLLLKMGYGGSTAAAGRALGRSGDDGVDGVIDQDALGLDRVYIQAKRYAAGNNIG